MNNTFIKTRGSKFLLIVLLIGFFIGSSVSGFSETVKEKDARMAWWREARFGMFIHWGLYAVPAGEWQGETKHAEWIRTTAQIPIDVYDTFRSRFSPVKFDARQWVRLAKEAGMKYIVITSKHHDGFCLFDSQHTDFDVMSTPFKGDIMKELAAACRDEGITICWYHSIMDWHHPDYLPRRNWEKERPAAGADFPRYVRYMKNQLRELVKNYGKIGVLWFDGEWEGTWNRTLGNDLYDYVRGLQPDIIINNRVGAGRGGMAGLTKAGEFAGDFGTPEQQIPATGLPGVDWETCMTMNDHWGCNKHDHNWKSGEDLLRKLADIASKGGNFLLNVGPTAAGLFPRPSIDRLKAIGRWMKVNGESIYGTGASPFTHLPFGRCTQKTLKRRALIAGKKGGSHAVTRLYLHVFRWPDNKKLSVPGIYNKALKAYLLADPRQSKLPVSRVEDSLVITVPETAPDTADTVVVLDITGKPDVNNPPEITAETGIFIDRLQVRIASEREDVEIRFTLDGTVPGAASPSATGPLQITKTTTVTARCFRDGKAVSGSTQGTFTRVTPVEPVKTKQALNQGVTYTCYQGEWDQLPDFTALAPVKKGKAGHFDLSPRSREDYFGFEYTGYIRIPRDGVYLFYTDSDDGSRLYIGEKLVVDNDGLHGLTEKQGVIALVKGLHPIRVTYFEKTGGNELKVSYKGPCIKKQQIPGSVLFSQPIR